MEQQLLSFGPFVLSPGKELRRDGAVVPVGQRGLLLLETMLAAQGQVVSKAEILERVWADVTVEEGNITVQIAALRKELGLRPTGEEWIVTVPRIGYRLVRDIVAPAAAAPAADSGKLAVAVLPFLNLSGDTSHDYFADGIVEDLITALSRFKSFAVVSRYSAFAYKGRAVDIRQVARELGVRYLLEGSVRLSPDRVRVTVQLVDATSGTHFWATAFDGELAQIFEFQDRVTESVIGIVEPQIRRAEIERTRRRWPENPQAYDHFLRALPYFNSRHATDYVTARGHLDQAIELQPDYAEALAYASWSLARQSVVSLTLLSKEDAERCLSLARAAMEFGNEDPVVLAICGHSLLAVGRMPVEGLNAIDRALAANPNHVVVLWLAGICNMLCGDAAKAEDSYGRAIRLSPGAPEAPEWIAGIGFARYGKGDFEAALEPLEQSRAMLSDWPPTHWILTATYANLGRLDEATVQLQRMLEVAPHTTIARVQMLVDRSDGRLAPVIDGLRKAGLK